MDTPETADGDYLSCNAGYWRQGYAAAHVESHVFRPYGRIFAHDFGFDGTRGERLLEFGCGAGAAAEFFHRKGFDVYGVEINEANVILCQTRMPEIASHFALVDPAPQASDVFFGGNFSVVSAIQCLYYLSEADLDVRLQSLHNQMTPGGILYATMMGVRHHYHAHSEPASGSMRVVRMHTPRISVDDNYVLFIENEDHLRHTFRLFQPCHVGYYAEKYREDEGEDFHYTFVGRKA